MRNGNTALIRGLILGLVLCTALSAYAQTYTFSTLYTFKNNGTDPAYPESYLTLDKAGNLYGTSSGGGSFGLGTVFKVNTKRALSVLHSFQGNAGNDGAVPIANVVFDASGNLDGTTSQGAGVYCAAGCGSVFSITPAGVENFIWTNFNSIAGYAPSYFALSAKGNVWGYSSGPYAGESGLVYSIVPFSFETWYIFCGTPPCPNGQDVGGPFVYDSIGNIYGATQSGGEYGYGFRRSSTALRPPTVLLPKASRRTTPAAFTSRQQEAERTAGELC
jgi:uncharacterized repeat protein (TIGR03803 family)